MTTKAKTQRVTEYNPRRNGKMIDRDMAATTTVVAPALKADKGQWYAQDGVVDVLTVRVWSTSAATRVSIWVHRGEGAAGHGVAAGYGYHRASAALQAACASAGIKFAMRFDGSGERSMVDAMRAIARHLGYRRCHVVGL